MKSLYDKCVLAFAVACFLYCGVIVYGKVRAKQECTAAGGIALQKVFGGVYCLKNGSERS